MARDGLSHRRPVPTRRVLARFTDNYGFDARVVDADGTVAAVVAGEIDMATAGLLRQAIELAERDGCVTIDLTGTTFIDSSGLTVLFDAHKRLGRLREAMVLHVPDRRIAQVVELIGLHRLVTIVDEPHVLAAPPAVGQQREDVPAG